MNSSSYIKLDHPLGIPRRVWCHIFAAVVAFIFVAPITFMALDRTSPVIVHSTAFSGDLRPGGVVKITWDATATRYCDGEVRRRLIDHAGTIFEYERNTSVIRPNQEIGRQKYFREIILPKSIATGQATMSVIVVYYCNPLQFWLNWPIVVERQRETLIIEEGPDVRSHR